jgi:hypothetical protein
MSAQIIDISKKNISGKCDLKCAYNFKYQESNTTSKNNGVVITLTYDNNKVPPVTYNNEKYTVTKIDITSPSIHNFNGKTADAEIIIEHAPVKGGSLLYVAIPIKSSSESSDATYLLNEIILNTSTNAPSESGTTNLSISGFTLNKIVPNKPYYSYTDNDKNNYIVFDILDAIPLNSKILETLQQIIKPFPIPMTGGKLFYNASGPNTTTIGDGIYISCKPTGSSKEEIKVEYSKNTQSYADFSNMLDNPYLKIIFQIIYGCILFILVFLILNFIYTWFTTGETKLPSMPKINAIS